MYFALSLIGDFDPVWIFTAVLLAALPTATNVFVMAQQYGSWVERASGTIFGHNSAVGALRDGAALCNNDRTPAG